MGDKYKLILHNASQQPNLTFSVYTVSPVSDMDAVYPLAWLAQKVNPGFQIEFDWELKFSLMFAAKGCQAGAVWTESKALDVDDNDSGSNSAQLGYPKGAYTFALTPGKHPAKPGSVYIDTTTQVPAWTQANGPSVGLAIATGSEGKPTPAIVGDSGPNLFHTFDLHPTYYIEAGHIDQGVMADLDTVTGFKKVSYAPGVFTSEWTLNKSNLWVEGPPKLSEL